jgi:hypothetical protein
MDTQLILDQYNIAKSTQLQKQDELLKILQNREVPLETRWGLYLKIEDSLDIDSFYQDLPYMDGAEITYYDDLYCDRYQTIYFSLMIEALEDSEKYSKEALDNLKEILLATGNGGCINDW